MAEIKQQIPINASPEKVYAALATEAGLGAWWTADTKVEEKVGGKAEFGFEKRQFIFRMRIEALEPGKRVVWSCHGDNPEWNGTTLTWTITPEDGVSVLRFSQSGWKEMTEMYASCNATWGELLYRLKSWAEGGKPNPHWRD